MLLDTYTPMPDPSGRKATAYRREQTRGWILYIICISGGITRNNVTRGIIILDK